MTRTLYTGGLLLGLCMTSVMSLAQDGGIQTRARAALGADFRTDDDRNADTYRLPAETLAFFGLKEDMRVMELVPGGGYYTKILGQILADKGKLYLGADGEAVADKLAGWGLDKVEVLDDKFEMVREEGERFRRVLPFSFPVSDLDMVLTFRNMHNIEPESRIRMNTEVFKSLKSGGVYGVIDHTRRHNEPFIAERWRRVDPVQLIKEMQDIGFHFVDYSDLHYRPDDDLSKDSTHESLNRNSDRFTLKFVKP